MRHASKKSWQEKRAPLSANKNDIYKTVKRYPGASTFEVSIRSRKSWATAEKYLKNLRKNKKVKSRKVGKKQIWF